mgnify:FL=1
MTQEDKELLLKDLCARLNTNLVCSIYRTDNQGYRNEILYGYCNIEGWDEFYFGEDCGISINYVSNIKPYLFPLSSMTREQIFEVREILGKNEIEIEDGFLSIIDSSRNTITYLEILALLNWFYKNHFDINGLIPMGLAIDATGLNMY